MSRKFRYPIRSYKHALQIYEDARRTRRGRAHAVPLRETDTESPHTRMWIRRYKLGWPSGAYVSKLKPEINWSMLDDAYLRDTQVPVGRIAFSYTFRTVRDMRDAVVWRPDNSCVISRYAGVPYENGMRNMVSRFSPVCIWRAHGQAWLSFTKKPQCHDWPDTVDWHLHPHKARPPRHTYRFNPPVGHWQQVNQGIVIPGDRRRAPYDVVSGDNLASRSALVRERKQARMMATKIKRYMRLIASDPQAASYLETQLEYTRMRDDLDRSTFGASAVVQNSVPVVTTNNSRTAGALKEETSRAIRFEEDFHV